MTIRGNFQHSARRQENYLAWILILIIGLSQSCSNIPTSIKSGEDQNFTRWLYLRDGNIPNHRNDLTELIIVGDIMLGRGIVSDYQPFRHVAQIFTQSDILIGNLEGAIRSKKISLSPNGRSDEENPFRITIDPKAAQSLKKASFDLVSLANNHSLDEGRSGLENTAAILSRSGIDVIGSGKNVQEANQAYHQKDG